MTQGIERAISDLQAHLRYHERAAEKLRQALAQLGELPRAVDRQPNAAVRTRSRATAAKRSPAKPTPTSARGTAGLPRDGRLTLARAAQYVLEQHREAGSGGVKPKVLYEQVQQAGYRFGGKPDNHLRQLYKTLRNHSEFKRARDGTYALG
jgi:HB1, ASXL, restriction endonuclease HTH domain